MTWTRISENWTDIADEAEVSFEAQFLHVRALVHCNRVGNDGLLKKSGIAKVGVGFTEPEKLIEELIEKAGWVRLDDGTVQVPWEDQETAEAVQERRATSRERQRQYRARGTQKTKERLAQNDVTRNDSAKSLDPVPNRTVPSRTEGTKAKGKGRLESSNIDEKVGDRSRSGIGLGASPAPAPPSVRIVKKKRYESEDEDGYPIYGVEVYTDNYPTLEDPETEEMLKEEPGYKFLSTKDWALYYVGFKTEDDADDFASKAL